MDTAFDKVANTWDTDFRIDRSKIISKKIVDNIPYDYFSNTLEYGCGTGLITFNFISKIKNGLLIDTSKEMINVVNKKINTYKFNNIRCICGDVMNISLNNNFTFIYSSMVLHHIDNIDMLAQKFYSLLSNDGILCIVDLCKDNGLFHKYEIGFHGHNGFDIPEIENTFVNNNFKIVTSEIIYKGIKTIDNEGHPYELFMLKMIKNLTTAST